MRLQMWKILVIIWLVSTCSGAKNKRYIVKLSRLDTFTHDENFCKVEGRTIFVNRTTKAMELTLQMKQEMDDTYAVHILFHKWSNNNWVKYSALQLNEDVKTLLDLQWFDLQSMFRKHCTPPLVWPWQKTTYKIRDFIFNSDEFPQFIPTGSYRADTVFYTSRLRTHKLFELNFYGDFIPLKNIPKN